MNSITVQREPNNSGLRVEVFGQAFHLHGTDPDCILKVAEYVDAEMRAIADETRTADSAHLAVMAAMNIAEEYHLLENKTG